MGFGFKYHVVTIAAIFFALTVGLVVGSLLVSPRVAVQQSKTLETLRKDVSADIKINRAERELAEKALAAFVPAAIKNHLAKATVAIIQTGDYPDATTYVREALTLGSAQIVSTTTLGHELDRPDEQLNQSLDSLRKLDARLPANRTELAELVASIIIMGDTSPVGMAATLEQENFMHTDQGANFHPGAKYVIIVGGTRSENSDRVSRVDKPLITALQRMGVTVLLCESTDAHVSDVDTYKSLGIAVTTVDNIDSDIGRGALVYAIGGDIGSYGVRKGDDLVPPELTRQGSP